jgi:hypothetical protein
LSGLSCCELAESRKSGPVESRLKDWRGRILGSEMPARVLSRAAAASARKPPDLCELVEGRCRWPLGAIDGTIVLVWAGPEAGDRGAVDDDVVDEGGC